MQIKPSFKPFPDTPESPSVQKLISTLKLQKHVEGGYYLETDRSPLLISNPFLTRPPFSPTVPPPADNTTRSASTSIFYLLTPNSPQGHFHRNAGRTIHTLHRGRGVYVIIHADELTASSDEQQQSKKKARVETFVVGHNVEAGERLQWIVEGGKFKASFLLEDEDGKGSEGLLISETVVPGFEFADHDFLRRRDFGDLVSREEGEELAWLVRDDDDQA